jgi:hypothetical protein
MVEAFASHSVQVTIEILVALVCRPFKGQILCDGVEALGLW